MTFIIFITLIAGLQIIHRRLLHQLLPRRCDRWTLAALVLIHLPLAFYMGIRLTGHGNALPWLRPLARGGAYFQMLTVMDLLVWSAASLVWRWTHLWRTQGKEPPENPQRRKFLRQTSVVGVGLAGYGVLRGSIEAHSDPDIIRLELSFPDLPPGLDGLRLVQISDLHAGPLVLPWQVQRWRRLAEGERPDLLVITGDMVDSLPHEAGVVADAFRGFRAPLGCYAILGNHDYYSDAEAVSDAVRAAGVTLLVNEGRVIRPGDGGGFALLGLDDQWSHKYGGPGPRLSPALARISPDLPRILLSHQPDTFEHYAGRVALQLSGHTHGGQIRPANLVLKWVAGRYERDGSTLYVNRGFGVAGPPARLGVPPELTKIILVAA